MPRRSETGKPSFLTGHWRPRRLILRSEAAAEVLRVRYPCAYRFWREHHREGFAFDATQFLNPEDWFVKELETDFHRRVLILVTRRRPN